MPVDWSRLPAWRVGLGASLGVLTVASVAAWIVFQFITPSWNAVWLVPATVFGLLTAWAVRWDPPPDLE